MSTIIPGPAARNHAVKLEVAHCVRGVTSPLLANLYMRRFILAWHLRGLATQLDAHMVSYADDLVLCCRGTGQRAYTAMQTLMGQLKLTVNEDKTSVRRLPEESVDFLGYTIGRCYSPRTGRAFWGMRPSRKAVIRVCREISELTHRRWELTAVESRVTLINRFLRGWAQYFSLGQLWAAYQAIDTHVRYRLRQWLCRKRKLPGHGIARLPNTYLYGQLGLVRLRTLRRNLPWATA